MPNVVEVIVRTRDEASKGLKEANLNVETFRKSLLALSPAAIPALGGITAGVGLVGASFGGAALTVGVFGAAAKSVLADASSNLQKLQELERRAATARTAAQKQAVEQQIKTLEAGWSKGYLAMIGSLEDFKNRWTSVSQQIAVPALTSWLKALTDGMKFLLPLATPVAGVFRQWGQDLDRYFTSKGGSEELGRMATELGRFGAQQMKDIGKFIVDLGKGVFNLGRDLAGHNVDFGTFGKHLVQWGDAFAKWSQSAGARADVSKFLAYLRQNGGLVRDILKDVAKILPNLFSGLSGAGESDLRLITGFFNLVAGLPPWMQKWIGEGLPLFLIGSKVLPVIAAASKLVSATQTLMGTKPAFTAAENAGSGAAGSAAGNAASGAGGGLLTSIMQGLSKGALVAAGAAIAAGIVLKVREDLKSGFQGIIRDLPNWFNFGTLGPLAVSAQGWADLIVSKIRHSLMSWEDDVRHYIAGSFDKTRHDVASIWDGIIGFLSGSWSKLRHDAASAFDGTRHDIAARFDSMRHDAASFIAGVGSGLASGWSRIRSTASSAWSELESTVKSVAGRIVSWVGGLPGRFVSALSHLPGDLRGVASLAMNDMLGGFKSVGGGILSWLDGFVKSVINKIKSLLGIHSPSSVFYDIGKNMMLGLKGGIEDHAHQAANRAVNNAKQQVQKSSGGVSGAGPVGGDEATNKALARKMFPWPASMWPDFDYLEMREAGYNRFARNPSSGAYGIPQALPPTKMPFAAQAAGGSHAGPQLSWMFSYIRSTYGNPVNAAAHERSHNWYAAGGPTSAGWAVLGEHGRELVKLPGGAHVVPHGGTEGMLGGAAMAAAGLVQLEIKGGQSEFEQFMSNFIKRYVRVNGGGNVQRAFGRQ